MQWCEVPGCSNEVAKQRKKCPACLNEIRKLKKYGVDPYWYEKKFEEQHGVCAICKKFETEKFRGKVVRLAVDHNHTTGQLRGLLCAACNRAIGLMKEDPQRLEAAARYLRHHESKTRAS